MIGQAENGMKGHNRKKILLGGGNISSWKTFQLYKLYKQSKSFGDTRLRTQGVYCHSASMFHFSVSEFLMEDKG